MKILVTGATGLVGTELVGFLMSLGHDVNYLSTSKSKLNSVSKANGFFWDPDKGIIDESSLIGVETIVHLAGASVAKRWTDAYKQEIIESRTFSSNLLFKVLKDNPHHVRQIISASAIGIYQDSLTNKYYEDSPEHDRGFLGHVVLKWEAGADKFRSLGIRVCKLRTGLVLSQKGGALEKIAEPITKGVGAHFGNGKHMQSWIHVEDLVRMYAFAVETRLEGTFNAVAPIPVSNRELTKAIASVLGKPLFLPGIPKFIMSIVLGEMHNMLYSSQNVSANKIMQSGFSFTFPTIESALQDLLKKKPLEKGAE